MRLAQWTLEPGSKGSQSAEVAIFYFGPGEGGSAEANLQRWYGQFEQPDGTATRDRAEVRRFQVNGLAITRADMEGTYVAEVRPGAPEKHHQPEYRMIAAVVEGPNGPWFIRLLGPEETVRRWEADFDRFLHSVRVE